MKLQRRLILSVQKHYCALWLGLELELELGLELKAVVSGNTFSVRVFKQGVVEPTSAAFIVVGDKISLEFKQNLPEYFSCPNITKNKKIKKIKV